MTDPPARIRLTRCRVCARQLLAALHAMGLDLLALLWPCACLVCGAANRELCAGCATALRHAAGHSVSVRTPTGMLVHAVGPYAGALRALLIGYKHGGRARFARLLGELLSGPLWRAISCRNGSLPVLVVTAPSRPARVRARGFQHLDLLVRRALRTGLPPAQQVPPPAGAHAAPPPQTLPTAVLLPAALRALPGRTGQVGLHLQQRSRNAALLRVPPRAQARLWGREVVLVDDIVTTGATLAAAVRALAAANARVIGVAVLGVTERRDLNLLNPGKENSG